MNFFLRGINKYKNILTSIFGVCLLFNIAICNDHTTIQLKKDSIRSLLESANKNKNINYIQSLHSAKRSLSLSIDADLKKEKAQSQFLICSMFYGNMNYQSQLQHCDEAFYYYEFTKSKDTLAWIYDYKGIFLDRMGKQEEALNSFHQSKKIFEQTGNKIGMATCLNDLAVLLNYMNDYSNSLSNYYASLKIFEEEKNEEGEMRVHASLGYFFKKQMQYDLALEHFEKALDFATKLNQVHWEIMCMRGMVKIFEVKGEEETAIQYLKKTIRTAELTGNDYELSEAQYGLAKINFKAGNLIAAEKNVLEALKIYNEQGREKFKSSIQRLLIKIKLKQNKTEGIKELLEETEELSHAANFKKGLANTYKLWSNYYSITNEPLLALEYINKYIELEDQINSKDALNAIAKIQNSYELGRKETEIALLNEKTKAQDEQLNIQSKYNIAFLGALFLGLVLLVVLIKSYYYKKEQNSLLEAEISIRTQDLLKANKALKRSNVELSRFAHIASHDMKEPIRNIVGFLQLAERKMQKNDLKEAANFIDISKKNALQMHHLIKDILEFSKSDKIPENAYADIKRIIHDVKNNIEKISKNNAIEIYISKLYPVNALNSDMVRLFQNLINNGIKFNNSSKPTIYISSIKEGNNVIFKIKDNGIGIHPDFHTKVFQMFTRLHNRKDFDGTGLGLAISKKIVEKYGGSISLESEIGEGSTFTFSLPLLITL